MRLALLLALPSLALVPTALAASEGEVVDMVANVTVAWDDLAPGDYWLAYAAGPQGARLDLRGLGEETHTAECPLTANAETPPDPRDCADGFSRMGPTNAQGSSMSVREGDAPYVILLEGDARALLARPDLHRAVHLNGTHGVLRAAGTVAAGGCVAQSFHTGAYHFGPDAVTRGDVTIIVAARGASIALLDSQLSPFEHADEALAWTGDPDARASLGFVQVCAHEDTTEYVIRATRVAGSEESTREIPLPASLVAAVVIARALLSGRIEDRKARR